MAMFKGRKKQAAPIKARDVRPRQWADITRPVPVQKTIPATSSGGARALDITFKLPSLPFATVLTHMRRLIRRIGRKALLVSVAVVIVAGVYFVFITRPTTTENAPVTATRLTQGTPAYATVLPGGKTIQSLGGWTRVSPPDRNPVFAYTDRLGNVTIAVSEQPLPSEFQTDTESQVAQLALNFRATQKITLNGGTTIYIGDSVQGPQSVIFTKKDLLILVKSEAKIDNNRWVQYISSLN